MNDEPTVFVVDDDPGMRRSLALLLKSARHACRLYESAEQFLDNFPVDVPGCLVLDVRMPGMTGLELQDELKRRGVRLPVIVVSGYAETPNVVRAVKNGAVHFLEKPYSEHALLDRVQVALVSAAEIQERQASKQQISNRFARLTQREQQVMELLLEGRNTKQIGAALEISPKTADIHRARILEKTDAESVVELLLLANELGS